MHTTPQERQALGVTALLLLVGAGVRVFSDPAEPAHWRSAPPVADTTTGGEVRRLRQAAESEQAREQRRAAPLRPGERIDPNRAPAEELERLPRVGPALAARIVEWRERSGPFRTLADLDAVPGVGPALLASLAGRLTLPAGPPAAAPGAGEVLDLNRAGAAELDALPGIGPVLAERIVEWRRVNGPFSAVEDLQRVPGIGPALLRRLAPRLRVGS